MTAIVLVAAVLIVALIPEFALSSSWNATLLVNTEGFQVLDDSDTAADLKLRFGDTVAEEVYWSRANARFDFTDDVNISGNVTASGNLIVSGDAKAKGDITVNSDNGAADAVFTFGSDTTVETLKFLNNEDRFEFSDDVRTTGKLEASGALIVDGAATFKSTVRINGVTYTFPYSDGTATGKVLKTDSAGKLSWSTDSGGSGIDYATVVGSFVNESGDGMTGALAIKSGGAKPTAKNGYQLEVIGATSGAIIHAQSELTSSGRLTIETVAYETGGTLPSSFITSGALVVRQNVEGATGAYLFASGTAILALDGYQRTNQNPHIMFGYRGRFDTNLFRQTGSRLRTDGSLWVGVTMSGAAVRANNLNASQSAATGSILVSNATMAPEWKAPKTSLVWFIDGKLFVTATGSAVVTMPYGMLISTGSLRSNVAPTGASVQVNILNNGSSIFSTKPSIAASAKSSDKTGTLSSTTLKEGDLVWVSIDQIGSTIAGSGLTIMLTGTRKY